MRHENACIMFGTSTLNSASISSSSNTKHNYCLLALERKPLAVVSDTIITPLFWCTSYSYTVCTHRSACTHVLLCVHIHAMYVPGSMPGYANLVLLFSLARSFTHIAPVYPAAYWGPGGLVSSGEAAYPAVTSMGTWCLLGKQIPNCPCLA